MLKAGLRYASGTMWVRPLAHASVMLYGWRPCAMIAVINDFVAPCDTGHHSAQGL